MRPSDHLIAGNFQRRAHMGQNYIRNWVFSRKAMPGGDASRALSSGFPNIVG